MATPVKPPAPTDPFWTEDRLRAHEIHTLQIMATRIIDNEMSNIGSMMIMTVQNVSMLANDDTDEANEN